MQIDAPFGRVSLDVAILLLRLHRVSRFSCLVRRRFHFTSYRNAIAVSTSPIDNQRLFPLRGRITTRRWKENYHDLCTLFWETIRASVFQLELGMWIVLVSSRFNREIGGSYYFLKRSLLIQTPNQIINIIYPHQGLTNKRIMLRKKIMYFQIFSSAGVGGAMKIGHMGI